MEDHAIQHRRSAPHDRNVDLPGLCSTPLLLSAWQEAFGLEHRSTTRYDMLRELWGDEGHACGLVEDA